MPSPNAEKRSDPPCPKRQKMEETGDESDSDDSECGTPEEIQLFYDEDFQGFEIDFAKLSFSFEWKPLDLDDSTMVDDPETNRDFIAMLANLALTQHNAERNTSLELVKVLRANFHPSAGATFYISFEVKEDPSEDGNQTKPYRAVVRYLPRDMEVVSCFPKPTS
ncbi:hypothetical protein EUTSA_v10015607mg [Eutrema salsugineum]|uniref:Cystatin domain-containing protein n=1 Tax=Eutrema salsugineum TaxID=72664 RepID=V4N4S5_EUTSA|nr:hypothetical protein EUTSA_v10015607mg [Eutrema salsugineum]